MQVNSLGNTQSSCFKAKISQHFYDRAVNYCTSTGNNKLYNNFIKSIEKFKSFGNDKTTVYYAKSNSNGEHRHILTAVDDSVNPSKKIVLTSKDVFRKVIEKFTHINEYEFNTKMK